MGPLVIALGFFDGVHLGHGQLLSRCRQVADRLGLEAAALTFDTHPDTLVSGQTPPLLNTPEDRARLMTRRYGIDRVLTLHFDKAMMHMPWETFLEDVLLGQFHGAHLVCGYDFRFGDRGAGTPELLRQAAAERGVGCDVIPPYTIEGTLVSSTYVRKLLLEGETQEAMRFLGHPHFLTGTVVYGNQVGRTLGIPTANLTIPPGVIQPRRGVYACRVTVEGNAWAAVTNVGTRPTVGGQNLTVEPWLLNYSGDLYGKELRVDFYKFLRPERKFDSLEALKAEIHRNARQTLDYFHLP